MRVQGAAMNIYEHVPEWAWDIVDQITTDCPLCGFLRGVVAGLLLGLLF